MEALKVLNIRKSIRIYESKPVEEEKIKTVIEAANGAPKASPFHITVVLNADAVKEINDKALAAMKASGVPFLMERAAIPGYQPLYGAPMLLIFSAPEHPQAPATCACAATTATIAATDLGLGSCYAVTPTLAVNGHPELAKKIGLPEGFKAMCGVLLGYAGAGGPATPSATAPNNINYFR